MSEAWGGHGYRWMVIGKVAGFGLLDVDLYVVMCFRWHVTMRLDKGQKLGHVMTDNASV